MLSASEISVRCSVMFFAAARAERFVLRPTDRTVVDDRVVGAGHAHAVERDAGDVAGPDADVADDDVVRAAHAHVVLADADAFAGRGLAGDREVRIVNDEPRFERDQAADVEHDGPRPLGFDRRAQAARAAVVEIGDFDHAAAASAAGEPAVAFRAGKREVPDAESPDVAFGDRSAPFAVHFVDAPVVGGERIDGVAGELRLGLPAAILGRRRRGGGHGVAIGAEIDVVGHGRFRRLPGERRPLGHVLVAGGRTRLARPSSSDRPCPARSR